MKKEIIPLEFLVFQGDEELDTNDQLLLQRACKAADDAFAPYSRFKVGAAVLLDNGEIITGNNQENPAYPSGLCAERVAVFYAMSKFPGIGIQAVAITATSQPSVLDRPVPPCGACRQVMADFENRSGKPMRIIMRGQKGPVMICEGMNMLLPLSFNDEYLPK